MKTIKNSLKVLALLLVLAGVGSFKAQVLNPNFSHTVNAGGQVTFSSTSVGTSSNTTYHWNFGDPQGYPGIQSPTDSITHTYGANGIYVVRMVLNSSASNSTSVSYSIVVNTCTNTGCFLNADFTASTGGNASVQLTNLSTGTTAGTTYSVDFGDDSPVTWFGGHRYPYEGTFTITLTANNNYTPACISTKTTVVSVSGCTCTVKPGFTITHLGGATYQFIDTSIAAYTSYSYWNFGDGSPIGSGDTVTHTYTQDGNYTVLQEVGSSGCGGFKKQQVNVTGTSCVANSNFTFAPSGTPQWWNVFPSYPYNVSNAVWNWGDGNTSNSLYTSHAYASAGTYTICLTVTVTCGDTSSTCSSYAIYKSTEGSSEMIGVNVLEPETTTGIKNTKSDAKEFVIYPNPGNGNVKILSGINSKATIQVYSLIGKLVYSEDVASLQNTAHELNLTGLENGIYFVKVSQGSKTSTEKIVITK